MFAQAQIHKFHSFWMPRSLQQPGHPAFPNAHRKPEWQSPPQPQVQPKVLFWCPPPSPKASAPPEHPEQQSGAFFSCPYPSPLWPSDPCLLKPSDHALSSKLVNRDVFKLSSCSASISSILKQISPLAKSCVEPVPPLTSPYQAPRQNPVSSYKKLPVWTVTENLIFG